MMNPGIRWPRISGFLLCLCLSFLLCLSEAGAELPTLIFQSAGLRSGQQFAVYSCPSTASWRGAKGKAAVSTNDVVYCAGWDDGWMLVMYETSNGKMRVGYVDSSKVEGRLPEKIELVFANVMVQTVKKTTMTDDPRKASSNMTTLKKGTSVTFLSQYEDWAYIETTINKQSARGFVKLTDLALDEIIAQYDHQPDDAAQDDEWLPDPDAGDAPGAEGNADPSLPQATVLPGDDSPTVPADNKDGNDYDHDRTPSPDDLPDENNQLPAADKQPDSNKQPDAANPDTIPSEGPSNAEPSQSTDASAQIPPPQNDAPGIDNQQRAGEEPADQPAQQTGTWTEDGVTYTGTSVTPVTIPEPPTARHGASGEGESTVTDVGADWYGIAYRLYDDNIDLFVYETDSRGYLNNLESGYVCTNYLDTSCYGASRTARLYELPNGDLLSEYYESASVDKYGYPAVLEFWHLLRPNGNGFTRLMEVFYNASLRRVAFTDYRRGFCLSADLSKAYSDGLMDSATEWLSHHLEAFFADWGLSFARAETLEIYGNRHWKNATILSSAMIGKDSTLVLVSPDANYLPTLIDLQEESKSHYIAPQRTEEDILAVLTEEMADSGVQLTQTAEYTRDTLLSTEYRTSDPLTITVFQDIETKKIVRVIVDDTKLYKFRLCKSAADLGKLETTFAMRRAWNALTSCPCLGLTAPDEMSAFDLEWNQTETTPGQFYVFAAYSAGNANAELRRIYQRAGAESITSRLTLDIQ